MFTNKIDYTRNPAAAVREEFQDYSLVAAARHNFEDMYCHEAEVAAVRLAEAGIFEKTNCFEPEKLYTFAKLLDAVAALAKLAGTTVDLSYFSADAPFTRGALITLLAAVTEDTANADQYKLLLSDADSLPSELLAAYLKCIALGLVPAYKKAEAEAPVTRGDAALALWRLYKPGMRLVTPYDLGETYEEGKDSYIVKNTYTLNESGIQLGTWSRYNWQWFCFKKLGKRPMDRVDFHKWIFNEQEPGVYKFGAFGNEQIATRVGSTVINSIEIAANMDWNPRFPRNHIPEFYKPDITVPETREAAKKYMYAFVQESLKKINGDLFLSLDYEVDWEMNLEHADEGSKLRAALWGQWYAEASEVARKAAEDMGASDRLKLMVIYNNLNELSRLGPEHNEWMLKCAKASDYIGIDVYFYERGSDETTYKCACSLISDMRYLIKNYSLGKPVMIIENGLCVSGDRVTEEGYADYFRRLFREFKFTLSKGDFLDSNFNAYLFWDLVRYNNSPTGTGVYMDDGTPYPSGVEVEKGFADLEAVRQYNPCLQTAVAAVEGEVIVDVKTGIDFEKLTLVTAAKPQGNKLRVVLKDEGTVCVTVNGKYNYPSITEQTEHIIEIPEGFTDGCNTVQIFFGIKNNAQTVLSAEII